MVSAFIKQHELEADNDETEFSREKRIFDETEPGINLGILEDALARQKSEQARCALLRDEVAKREKKKSKVAGSNKARDDVAGPSNTRGRVAGLSEPEDNVAGEADPSPADFLKAWKKIGSAKENKDWNGMEREDCDNCVAKGRQCERSAAGKCRQCAEDHGKCSWVKEYRRWRVKNEYGWDDAKIDEALKRVEGSETVGMATPKIASRVGAGYATLPVPGTPTRPNRMKRTRVRSRSPTPGPSTSKRRVAKPASSRELVEEQEKVAGSLVPRSDLERELATLRKQALEPSRKIVWVPKSDREVELEEELASVRRELEEAWRSAKAKGKEAEETRRESAKVPASKIMDAKVAELMARAEGAEREFEALHREWEDQEVRLRETRREVKELKKEKEEWLATAGKTREGFEEVKEVIVTMKKEWSDQKTELEEVRRRLEEAEESERNLFATIVKMEKELSASREQEQELRSRCTTNIGELREARFRGRRGLETVFFAYEDLLLKSPQELPSWVEKWAEQEQRRVRRELLDLPRVDQWGVELKGPEGGEEEKGGEEGKVASVEGGEGAEGSRKGKQRARD